MSGHSNRREREELQELLKAYHALKNGRHIIFLEEEDFERIIDYFDDKEDTQSASEAADVGLEQFPFSSLLRFKKADMLIALRNYKDALQILQEAELYDANDIALYILKTDAYLALDEPQKAAKLLEEALDKFVGDDRIELLFELSDVYDDYEEFEKVFDCLHHILQEDPENDEALLKICFWADFTGRAEESISLHRQIVDNHPFNELAWFNLATAFQTLKLYEKAIDAYQYALAIDDKMEIAYRNMGDAYIRLRRYKEAIECLSKVLELSRPEDVIYEAIGHCYHKMENWAQARFNYRKASHLNPEDSRLYYKIAVTYYKENQWEQAVKQLGLAMRVHKRQADYNLLMGQCKMEQGKLKEAIQFLSVAVEVRPKNIGSREVLIDCLLQAGYAQEALDQSEEGLSVSGGNPIFKYTTCAALFNLGKPKEALLQLEHALSVNHKGFRRLMEMVPGLMQRPAVLELANKYLRKK